jgi:hypothetical protein
MTKELLDQAYNLYCFLDKKSWDVAIEKNRNLYDRYNALSQKALKRYERRFENYRSNH